MLFLPLMMLLFVVLLLVFLRLALLRLQVALLLLLLLLLLPGRTREKPTTAVVIPSTARRSTKCSGRGSMCVPLSGWGGGGSPGAANVLCH